MLLSVFSVVTTLAISASEQPSSPPNETADKTTADANRKDGLPMLPPNELGSVMVLMYHDIRSPESTWDRTPENFEKDLQTLYAENFRPISLSAFVSGRIDLPRGTAPVVITFDDGTAGQFQLVDTPDGPAPDPRSAVGILESFHRTHPDFPLEATFFVHGRAPFGDAKQAKQKLRYLLRRGMDIGNHTTLHQNLREKKYASADKIQAIIGGQARFLESLTRDEFPAYKVDTLALCYGQRPGSGYLRHFLTAGTHDGFTYRNRAVLNVGAAPSVAPFDRRFNPASIPRVRASERNTGGVGLYDWLRRYKRHPERRYISDGDPDRLTIPATMKARLATEKLQGLEIVTY